ncbi:hypothetical protein Bca4012_051156 [Brassica carinata]
MSLSFITPLHIRPSNMDPSPFKEGFIYELGVLDVARSTITSKFQAQSSPYLHRALSSSSRWQVLVFSTFIIFLI